MKKLKSAGSVAHKWPSSPASEHAGRTKHEQSNSKDDGDDDDHDDDDDDDDDDVNDDRYAAIGGGWLNRASECVVSVVE